MSLQDLDRKISRLTKLRSLVVVVKSQGRYPTKARTLVADVCRYQNNGTERISPSRFIERAELEAIGWQEEKKRAYDAFLRVGGVEVLSWLANLIARDISRVCDRIRTGQLKDSFIGSVERI